MKEGQPRPYLKHEYGIILYLLDVFFPKVVVKPGQDGPQLTIEVVL